MSAFIEAYDFDSIDDRHDDQPDAVMRRNDPNTLAYDRKISKIPLLTPKQERALGKKIQAGQDANEAVEYAIWAELEDDNDVTEWKRLAKEGEIARHELVTANLRYAAYVARLTMGLSPGNSPLRANGEYAFKGSRIKNLARLSGAPLSLDDRIQIATAALYDAADHFDPDKGRFTTVAMWYIEKDIERAIDKDRNLGPKIPQMTAIRKLGWAVERLAQHASAMPGDNELANELGLTVEDVRRLKLWEAMGDHQSLEFLNLDGAADLVERARPLADDITPDEDYYEQIDMEMITDSLLRYLNSRERDVIAMRTGMVGGDPMTQVEVGQQFGVTGGYIHTLEREAFKKLRSRPELHGYSRRHYY
jgi:RNA polymerase nonessential primary-like sigma factor